MSQTDEEYLDKQYSLLCEDIARERLRIGGDWAIAGVILTKHGRDLMRSQTSSNILLIKWFIKETIGAGADHSDTDDAK